MTDLVAKAQKRISKMLTRKASNAPSESNSESFDDGRYLHVQKLFVHHFVAYEEVNRCDCTHHWF